MAMRFVMLRRIAGRARETRDEIVCGDVRASSAACAYVHPHTSTSQIASASLIGSSLAAVRIDHCLSSRSDKGGSSVRFKTMLLQAVTVRMGA